MTARDMESIWRERQFHVWQALTDAESGRYGNVSRIHGLTENTAGMQWRIPRVCNGDSSREFVSAHSQISSFESASAREACSAK